MKNTTRLNSTRTLLSLLLVGTGLFSACTAEKLEDPNNTAAGSLCDSVTITFDAHVKPIFDVSCNYSGCHDDISQSTLTTYNSMTAARRDYAHFRVQDGSMPPSYAAGPMLSQAQVDTINCWKLAGYPEN